MFADDAIKSLREAVALSPENVPLRKYLANTLLENGCHEEAESEHLQALRLSPEDTSLKMGRKPWSRAYRKRCRQASVRTEEGEHSILRR